MTRDILVTGGNGQLGSELQTLVTEKNVPGEWRWYFTDKDELDITDTKAVDDFCRDNNINTIINCAAYTAVDKAESEEALADLINHQAAKNLATTAKSQHISLVHISTDYVFDGKNHKPYTEQDRPNPQSAYGRTKLAGEQAMQQINPANSIIIRTAWVYSSFGNNFVKTMLRLGAERDALNVVYDQVGSPTCASDLAAAIIAIIPQLDNRDVAIYHYSNEGVCSWYDFAKAIFELAGVDCTVNPIISAQYPTPAARPHFSVLDKQEIKSSYNVTIPYWVDSLRNCLPHTR